MCACVNLSVFVRERESILRLANRIPKVPKTGSKNVHDLKYK